MLVKIALDQFPKSILQFYYLIKEDALLSKMEVSKYIEFKRNIFSHKRKTLKNLLKNYDTLRNDIDLTLRVEEIKLSQLIKIFREVNL